MANKRNKTVKDVSNSVVEENKNTPLTEGQVWDVLNFARSFYSTVYGSSDLDFAKFQDPTEGSYTPYLTNERLAEIGLNPTSLTPEQLNTCLLYTSPSPRDCS